MEHPSSRAGAAQGLTVAVAIFLPIMAVISLAPVVPTMLAHFKDMPGAGTLVPMIVTAPGLMIALMSPVMGWAADRYGRRPILVWSILLYGFAGVAPVLLDGIYAILASRLLIGIAEAVILTVATALLSDYFETDRRRFYLTVQAVLAPFLAVSTIVVSGMLTAWRWNGAFLIYLVALPVFLAALLFLFEPKGVKPVERDREGQGIPWRIALGFVPLTFVTAILYYVYIVQGGLAFQAAGLTDPDKLGKIMGIASLGVPVGGLIFGYLSKRLNIQLVLTVLFIVLAIGLIGISRSKSVETMAIFSFVQQIASGMCVVSLIFWVSLLLAPRQRGIGFGLWTGAFFLGQFCGPIVYGLLSSAVGGVMGLFLLAGLASLGCAGWSLARSRSGAKPVSNEAVA